MTASASAFLQLLEVEGAVRGESLAPTSRQPAPAAYRGAAHGSPGALSPSPAGRGAAGGAPSPTPAAGMQPGEGRESGGGSSGGGSGGGSSGGGQKQLWISPGGRGSGGGEGGGAGAAGGRRGSGGGSGIGGAAGPVGPRVSCSILANEGGPARAASGAPEVAFEVQVHDEGWQGQPGEWKESDRHKHPWSPNAKKLLDQFESGAYVTDWVDDGWGYSQVLAMRDSNAEVGPPRYPPREPRRGPNLNVEVRVAMRERHTRSRPSRGSRSA